MPNRVFETEKNILSSNPNIKELLVEDLQYQDRYNIRYSVIITPRVSNNPEQVPKEAFGKVFNSILNIIATRHTNQTIFDRDPVCYRPTDSSLTVLQRKSIGSGGYNFKSEMQELCNEIKSITKQYPQLNDYNFNIASVKILEKDNKLIGSVDFATISLDEDAKQKHILLPCKGNNISPKETKESDYKGYHLKTENREYKISPEANEKIEIPFLIGSDNDDYLEKLSKVQSGTFRKFEYLSELMGELESLANDQNNDEIKRIVNEKKEKINQHYNDLFKGAEAIDHTIPVNTVLEIENLKDEFKPLFKEYSVKYEEAMKELEVISKKDKYVKDIYDNIKEVKDKHIKYTKFEEQESSDARTLENGSKRNFDVERATVSRYNLHKRLSKALNDPMFANKEAKKYIRIIFQL